MEAAIVLGVALTILLFLGVPIAFAIGGATLLSLLVAGIPTAFLGQGVFTSLDSFPSMAVPFFILAGAFMETGGLSRRIVNVAQAMLGNITGGLGIATILSAAIFAAISGSSPATVAAIGSIMIPAMVKKGYKVDDAAALSAAGGGLGIIIPPSIPMIIYGITANVSIGDMFLAGFGPGLVIVIILSLTVYLIARKKGYKGSERKFSFKELLKHTWDAKWALLSPILILGGIYSGKFTPTESAVIAVLYSLFVGIFVYKELKIKDIPQAITSSAIMSGAVLVILATATSFGRLITMYQIPNKLADQITGISSNPDVILLLIALIILIIGTFMETLSIIIILTPLFLPVVTALGVDPVHFGIIMVVAAEIGMLTPPVGVNLFVASGIAGINLERISKSIIPYLFAMIIALIIIILVPDISLFLPNLFD